MTNNGNFERSPHAQDAAPDPLSFYLAPADSERAIVTMMVRAIEQGRSVNAFARCGEARSLAFRIFVADNVYRVIGPNPLATREFQQPEAAAGYAFGLGRRELSAVLRNSPWRFDERG